MNAIETHLRSQHVFIYRFSCTQMVCGAISTMVTYSFITPHAFRRVFGLIEASICQTQDVPNSILSSVQVASTCRRDGSHDLSQRLPYYTTIVVDKVRERPWQDIYPESQSRSNIVDGCVILRMVSPPQCVGVIVRTGTFITHKFVGIQCSRESTSSLQRQCQIETDLNEDRRLNIGVFQCFMTWRILQWCCLLEYAVSSYIPGKWNMITDWLSRGG